MNELENLRQQTLVVKGLISEMPPSKQDECWRLIYTLSDQMRDYDPTLVVLALTLVGIATHLKMMKKS